jgi:hypothetical protein
LTNDGVIEVKLNLSPLAGPSLALQILDAQGSPVLLPPPPVPGGEPSWAVLAPGESGRFRFAGFVPGWTAPDRYRVRLRYVYRPPSAQPPVWTGELVSDWADFEVRG